MKKASKPKNNIKFLRQQKGLSSSDLAELIGTSKPHMSRLESGKTPLNSDWIIKISAALKVPTSEVADISFSRAFTSTADDTLVGSVLGWLLEANDQYQTKLSHQELSKWATFIYKKAAAKPLSADLVRDLTFTIVEVIRQGRK
jgi:transcriptional regulator with XRE-family HTH domain